MARSLNLLVLFAMLLIATGFPETVLAQGPDGPTGTSQQGLVNGQPVSPLYAEEYGLISLTLQASPATPSTPAAFNVCSGALLTNDWVITAAHCISPGNIATPNTVTVTANWNVVQTRQAAQIIRFGNPPNWSPWDIALVRLDYRLTVSGDTSHFKQLIWGDGPFANLNGYPVEFFGNGTNQFAQRIGTTDYPSSNDGVLRYGQAAITSADDSRYWYATPGGSMVAGGDSGGPSFVTLRAGKALTGVHSLCNITCLTGHNCATSGWTWVTATPKCGDAPVQPLWTQIDAIIHATHSPDPPAGPAQLLASFGATPPNYRLAVVYGIAGDGNVYWYRQDANATAWQGPTKVIMGWQPYTEVIPAGGNAFYALKADGSLNSFRHDGFNDGGWWMKGPIEVGHGWNFAKIFAGGDGIVYAVRPDGHLLWYQFGGYQDAGGVGTWTGPQDVGTGWTQFKEIFSMGQGIIYAVMPDGALRWYRHIGFANGTAAWEGPKTVGNGWQNFKFIVSLGDGIILAVTNDGKMLRYKHLDFKTGDSRRGLEVGVSPHWEGPVQIGTGWQGYRKIFAILPSTPSGPS